jgi:t-SNARE complex subunit (syntaxin)
MAVTMTAAAPEDTCHVSYDRMHEWKQCCLKAMGCEDTQPATATTASTIPKPPQAQVIQILNLMDDDSEMVDDDDDGDSSDHWMDNVNQIAASLTQMANMIAKNRKPYVSGELSEEEASILESTVLSFSATAANQIDSLREAIIPSSPDHIHFCSGIIASLMLRLREQVANPMASLQKQRTRVAIVILQHPLACRLVLRQEETSSKTDVWDQLIDDDDDEGKREQRFLPRQPVPAVSTDFMDTYTSTEDEMINLKRPPSVFKKKKQETYQPPPKQAKFSMDARRQEEERMIMYENEEAQQATQQELQREATLLDVSLQNELDSVYQVEQRMTEITALLSQFSSLVSEQQEEVTAIHQTAVSSKENITKGQESLIDAKERTKRSKHYMATFVWSVAILLLAFNYIIP